ncbi:MAG: hypothetical protein EOQ46_26240 [Mesorhizobium sp.]|nr:MAG: hypothetical protein EOQ46_26240 [Mesorhizobium sp.]
MFLLLGSRVGDSRCPLPKAVSGSSGWLAKFSVSQLVGSGESDNPLGAGAAACIAAANLSAQFLARS